MKSLLRPILLAILPAILSACTGEQEKLTFDKQETMIDSFVKTQLKKEGSYAVYQDGVVRVVAEKGEGADSLSADGVVSFYYALYRLTSSPISSGNLIATNHAETAGSSWALSDEDAFEIETVRLSESGYVEGLRKGLRGVRTGQECYILFSGAYGFGNKIHGTIPANSGLVYHIWVNSISNE